MELFFRKGIIMSGEEYIRKSERRTRVQKYFSDPLTGVLIVFGLVFFKFFPVDVASLMGAGIGRCLFLCMRSKNKIAMHNLQKCFPNKTNAECRAILKGMWTHFGRIIGEFAHLPKMMNRVEFTGQDFFHQAKLDGIGGFFFSGHLGNWELFSLIAHHAQMSLHPIYRAANNPWAEKWLYQKRKASDVVLIPKGIVGAKKMVELIKKGEHVALLCDQKLREGIDVPFFNHPAKTAPAIAVMALKFNVPIYPVRTERLKGAHYRVDFFPALEMPRFEDKQKNIEAVMIQVNQFLETWIMEHPEQWLWIHHRWDKKEYL